LMFEKVVGPFLFSIFQSRHTLHVEKIQWTPKASLTETFRRTTLTDANKV
jgi:hypothetical protein